MESNSSCNTILTIPIEKKTKPKSRLQESGCEVLDLPFQSRATASQQRHHLDYLALAG